MFHNGMRRLVPDAYSHCHPRLRVYREEILHMTVHHVSGQGGPRTALCNEP